MQNRTGDVGPGTFWYRGFVASFGEIFYSGIDGCRGKFLTHRAKDPRDKFARWTTVVAGVALTLAVAYLTVRSGASSALLVRMFLFVLGFLVGAALVRLAARLAVRRLGRPEPAELASALMGGVAAGLLPSLLPWTWVFVKEARTRTPRGPSSRPGWSWPSSCFRCAGSTSVGCARPMGPS